MWKILLKSMGHEASSNRPLKYDDEAVSSFLNKDIFSQTNMSSKILLPNMESPSLMARPIMSIKTDLMIS